MSVTLNHSPWLTMPSPSALSDCLGMAACCDIGPGPSLLWGRPVHCGMFRSLPGPCTTCQLGRAVISWLRESCCCEGSRSQPRALAPVGTFSRPSLLTVSVHDRASELQLRLSDTQAHVARTASLLSHSSMGGSAARVRPAARGSVTDSLSCS